MKKIILVISILFGIFIITTGFAAVPENTEINDLNKFIERNSVLEKEYIDIFEDHENLNLEEKVKRYYETIKGFEELKKNILESKEDILKDISESKVNDYNQFFDCFINLLEDHISIGKLTLSIWESGRSFKNITEKEANEMVVMIDKLYKSEENYHRSRKNITK